VCVARFFWGKNFFVFDFGAGASQAFDYRFCVRPFRWKKWSLGAGRGFFGGKKGLGFCARAGASNAGIFGFFVRWFR